MIFAVVAYLQIYNFVSAYGSSNLVGSLETKLKKGKSISDKDLYVDPSTFISYKGLRGEKGMKQNILRHFKPKFHAPSTYDLKMKIIFLMKQAIYDAQDHIRRLDPMLQKYKDDPALRMAFTFDRLEQLVIDSKRLFTVGNRSIFEKRFELQMVFYSYNLQKFFDVIYIVEHLINTHAHYLELLGVHN